MSGAGLGQLGLHLLQGWFALQALHLYLPLVGAIAARLSETSPPEAPDTPPSRLAVLIAARDEARVITGALQAWQAQTYPLEAYDVYVVADHCSDQTAALARRTGATVLERQGDGEKTKGAALRDLWLSLDRSRYRGVVIADADNRPAPDCLAALAAALARGHRAVQGLRAPAGADTPTARLDALSELCTHRIACAGRTWLGLGAPLMGSGMAFDVATFESLLVNWRPTLVEDCAWQAQLAAAGIAVFWTAEAIVRDEKTPHAAAMGQQRRRWLSGRAQAARRHAGALLEAAVRQRRLLALDTLLDVTAPPRSLQLLVWLTGFLLAVGGLQPWGWGLVWGACLALVPVYLATALWLDGQGLRQAGAMLASLSGLPRLTWQLLRARAAALGGRPQGWIPTRHGEDPATQERGVAG
ncbi:MAG: glycosyltransferase family 2 protein [Candidatus Sericytochromatia bacterium]|nr:glycosyltransferase family 2 protein [Candidatus Sericytochromatia bacterium]